MAPRTRIRVLLAGPYPHPGGMTGTYGRILENLRTSTIFADDAEFIPHRVTLPADGNPVRRLLLDLSRARRSLRARPRILHIIMQKYRALYREFPFVEMARRRGVKTLIDIRAGSLQQMFERRGYRLQRALMRRIVRDGDSIVLECAKDMEFVRRDLGREGLHVPNAVLATDFERIRPTVEVPDDDHPIRLIHSGRYARDKGTGTLLEATRILSDRGVRAELHLTGQGKEPDILALIRRYVEAPPPGIPVIDHGWDVPDLYGLLASAHVFVMPTTWRGEGHPNAVSEAMMCGLGMILTDWLHREDIVPDKGSIVVPPRDPAALADAVERYANDRELLAASRAANRRRVENRYLDRVCYPRFLSLYERLACGGPG